MAYYNPASIYPSVYPYQNVYSAAPQPTYQQPVQQRKGLDWVDGEAEAKGRPLLEGETQHAMWDINEPVIYLKSLNQMGMPNPLQKLRYTIENSDQLKINDGVSGHTEDMSKYATKEDFDQLRNEIKQLMNNQNGSNNSNRGGNR